MWTVRASEDKKTSRKDGPGETPGSHRSSPDIGTYILVIKLANARTIKPGNLPATRYEKGIYLYIGRARKRLRARIDRHLRSRKKIFWHVDYLLQKAIIEDVWVRPHFLGECLTAARLEKLLSSPVAGLKGFGSSDCRCSGHLFYFSGNTEGLPALRAQLGFERMEADDIRR